MKEEFKLDAYLERPRRVVTRNGSSVRIICTDFKNTHSAAQCIVAVVEQADGTEDVETYDANGHYCQDGEESGLDLVFEDNGQSCWVNIYRDSEGRVFESLFHSEGEAQRRAIRPDFLRTVKIPL